MATYTVTTTDLQDAALSAHVAQENVRRRQEGLEPYADNQAYVTARVDDVLLPLVEAYMSARVNRIVDAVRVSTLDRIDAADRELGIRDVR